MGTGGYVALICHPPPPLSASSSSSWQDPPLQWQLQASPLVSESSFVTCYVSKLTNWLLPLPPLQQVSPHLQCATFPGSPVHSSLFHPSSKWILIYDGHRFNHSSPPMCSSLFLPSSWWVLVCDVPHFRAHECAPPFPPQVAEQSFVPPTCHIGNDTTQHE